ncbi:hypothetical protein HGRIS_000889 [Hohenbuehelia grisea]|uniref:F-box domain-containing protein n=1 Tax=Hohenbuehelia grisea TaxID=104357 RepID=A0ABR3IQ24_9AGAR
MTLTLSSRFDYLTVSQVYPPGLALARTAHERCSFRRSSCQFGRQPFIARGGNAAFAPTKPLKLASPAVAHPSSTPHTATSPAPLAGTPSFIQEMPVEILCDIFMLCHLEERDNASTESRGARVIISHVCRRWRHVALCMPLLWSRISATMPTEHCLPRVETYLDRSALCPLSIRIFGDAIDTTWTERLISSCLEHSHRWRSIRLTLSNSFQTSIPILVGQSSFPNLEVLDLSLRGWDKQSGESLLNTFSEEAHIARLSWEWISEISFASLPFVSRLTHLNISGLITFSDAYHILSQCSNATVINLSQVNDPEPLTALPLLTMPKLQALSLTALRPCDSLYNCINAPDLKTLTIQHYFGGLLRTRDWEPIGSFLVRSGCKLNALEFRDQTLEDGALDRLFALPGLQTLRDLTIHQPDLSDQTLATLSGSVGGVCLLPKLKSLVFWGLGSRDGAVAAMASVRSSLSSRGPEYCNLIRLRTHLRSSQRRDMSGLEALKSSGMDIVYA